MKGRLLGTTLVDLEKFGMEFDGFLEQSGSFSNAKINPRPKSDVYV